MGGRKRMGAMRGLGGRNLGEGSKNRALVHKALIDASGWDKLQILEFRLRLGLLKLPPKLLTHCRWWAKRSIVVSHTGRSYDE